MKHKLRKQVRVDHNGRYVHRKRLQGTACEGCARQLQQTHDYATYGLLCRACWFAAQGVVVSDDESDGL